MSDTLYEFQTPPDGSIPTALAGGAESVRDFLIHQASALVHEITRLARKAARAEAAWLVAEGEMVRDAPPGEQITKTKAIAVIEHDALHRRWLEEWNAWVAGREALRTVRAQLNAISGAGMEREGSSE